MLLYTHIIVLLNKALQVTTINYLELILMMNLFALFFMNVSFFPPEFEPLKDGAQIAFY
jgi:hypothetical protein